LYANGLQSHALTDPALRHRLDESLITYPQNILVMTLTPLLDRLMLSPLPGGSEPENANASSHRRDGFIGRPNIESYRSGLQVRNGNGSRFHVSR